MTISELPGARSFYIASPIAPWPKLETFGNMPARPGLIKPVFTQNHSTGYTRPFHGAHGAFAHPPLLSASRVRAPLEV